MMTRIPRKIKKACKAMSDGKLHQAKWVHHVKRQIDGIEYERVTYSPDYRISCSTLYGLQLRDYIDYGYIA